MILNIEKIREISCGAVRIGEKDGYIEFDRFNSVQYENQKSNEKLLERSQSCSGVRIAAVTDSENLSFDYKNSPASSDPMGYFDIYTDGAMIAHVGGENESEGRVKVSLGKGEKKLEIYFPWSKRSSIKDFTLDDNAKIKPLKRRLKLLAYGDSITQGYIAEYPSLTYISRLASMLDADVLNKGIGGDCFSDRIISSPDDFKPDIITVAYGTNDWNSHSAEDTQRNIRRFFSLLRATYPEAKIFAITPIWRSDFDKKTQFPCTADKVEDMIRENIKGIYDIIVFSGWNLVPHLPEFFADKFLHPNDLGFGIYAENLYKKISKYI